MKQCLVRILPLVSAVLLCSSCASIVRLQDEANDMRSKRFDPPPAGWSGLYIYRPWFYYLSAWSWKTWVDGQYIGRASAGSYFHRWVRPGPHWVQTPHVSCTIDAKDGENTFVEELAVPGLFWNTYYLTHISPDQGGRRILDGNLRLIADRDNSNRDRKDADYREGKGSIPAFSPEERHDRRIMPIGGPFAGPAASETPMRKALPAPDKEETDAASRLRALGALRSHGVVSDEEYARKRAAIIESL